MAVRALIFDFDGVLADTEDLHYAAFQSVAASVGVALARADYYGQFLGLPDRECFAALCERAGVPANAARLDELVARKRMRYAQLSRTTHLYPGVPTALRQLHPRFIFAVASGAFRDEIEAILERDAVQALFTAIVGAEDVRAGKPAPDPFLEALRQINLHCRPPLTAAECVVLEDSPRGIAAAHAAGMRCLGVTTHHDRATLTAADAWIEHVSQLRPEDLEG